MDSERFWPTISSKCVCARAGGGLFSKVINHQSLYIDILALFNRYLIFVQF